MLIVVGGAAGMAAERLAQLDRVLAEWILPLLDRLGATVVDGGTDSGVMRVLGRARAAGQRRFPLVGVAAEGTVVLPDGPTPALPDAAHLEPHHTHTVLVPGSAWGDESPWLELVATVLAAGGRVATLLVNGGEISYADAATGLDRGHQLVVAAGTGRAADAVAAAAAAGPDPDTDPRALRIATAALTRIVDVGDGPGLVAAVESALA